MSSSGVGTFVADMKRTWSPTRPRCGECKRPLEKGRRFGRCQGCRQKQAERNKERYRKKKLADGPPKRQGRPSMASTDIDGERGRRVEIYAGIIASGRRLFE